MNNNTQKTAKARKMRSQSENSFLAAFVFGLIATAAFWLVLSALVPLVLGSSGDAGSLVKLVSPVVLVISLFAGGFVSGKIGKNSGTSAAILVGTAFLALSYILSTIMKLTNEMSVYLKTAYILLYIICPKLGARMAKNKKNVARRPKRR